MPFHADPHGFFTWILVGDQKWPNGPQKSQIAGSPFLGASPLLAAAWPVGGHLLLVENLRQN